MEVRKRLRVLGLSYNQLQNGAYVLLLTQEDGPYRIPVVIGASEAQSIAISLENIRTPRPLTHDLFVSFAHAFGVKLKEVFIYRFEDGIFYSELTFSDGDRNIVLDARTSDAIALALRTGTPIFTTPEILDQTGFIIDASVVNGESDDDDEIGDEEFVEAQDQDEASNEDPDDRYDTHGYHSEPNPENFSVEELQRTLDRLIANEDYEQAERISEILNRKLGRHDNN